MGQSPSVNNCEQLKTKLSNLDNEYSKEYQSHLGTPRTPDDDMKLHKLREQQMHIKKNINDNKCGGEKNGGGQAIYIKLGDGRTRKINIIKGKKYVRIQRKYVLLSEAKKQLKGLAST